MTAADHSGIVSCTGRTSSTPRVCGDSRRHSGAFQEVFLMHKWEKHWVFFWTSAAVREYFHRERTPQRKVRSSSSSLCLDYVDEGVPHLHASHSGGGRGSFIDFCEPQTCRSASFACFALLHLFYCKSDRRSILGKFTIFCTKTSYKQELESGSHRGVELLFVSPSTQLVCIQQQQQRESCD